MLTCHEVADFFLTQVDAGAGDLMSNLKLQKLLYYAQGLHLALNGKPLFGDPIEAWAHGPVVPALYHRFKKYGSGPVAEEVHVDRTRISDQDIDFLSDVYQVYGQFSAFKLRNMTHEEAPWKNASQGSEIDHTALTEFFKTRLA